MLNGGKGIVDTENLKGENTVLHIYNAINYE